MAMYDFNLFSEHDIAEDGKEGKHCRKRRGTIYDEEGDIVDFEAIRKIPDTGSFIVGMSDYYNFVSAVDELRRKLIDMTFDTSRLREEEIADHGNVVRHGA